jgi:hypothetical protein
MISANLLETDYVRALLLRLPYAFPDVRFFRRNVMAGKREGGGYLRVGEPGQCDLYGIGASDASREGENARHYEIEIKRYDKLSPAQEHWRDWCREWGVPWLLLEVRKGELSPVTIHRWVEEMRTWL